MSRRDGGAGQATGAGPAPTAVSAITVDARVEAYEEIRTRPAGSPPSGWRATAARSACGSGGAPDLGIVIKEERQRTAAHRLGAGTLRLQLVTYSMAPDPDP